MLGLHADSHTITPLQMAVRALLVFFVALTLLRLSGKRTFGSSPFDVVIQVVFGAVLSRAVVAASRLGDTLAACAVLVLLHRLLAWAAHRWHWIGRVIKGNAYGLMEERGAFDASTCAVTTSAAQTCYRACVKPPRPTTSAPYNRRGRSATAASAWC